MVGLHFLNGEVLPALRAFTALPLVGGACHLVGETAYGQVPFIARKKILVYSALVRDVVHILVVAQKLRDALALEVRAVVLQLVLDELEVGVELVLLVP